MSDRGTVDTDVGPGRGKDIVSKDRLLRILGRDLY